MSNLKSNFLENIKKLIGQKCFKVGFSIGSIIMLDFGRVTVNAKPMLNRKTNEIITRGEFGLRVETAWRILKSKKIYCTWNYYIGYCDEEGDYHDVHYKTLPLLEDNLIKILENKKVIGVFVDEDTMDVHIDFEDNIRFSVWCEQNHWEWEDAASDLYVYSTMKELFAIGTKDTIVYEDLKGKYIFYDDYLIKNN